jgi:hypothetical protein
MKTIHAYAAKAPTQSGLDEIMRDHITIREAKLDEMIADSFPASDPPSHLTSATNL